MPPLVRDRSWRAALALLGLASLPHAFAAPAPAEEINVSFAKATTNVNADDTQQYEGVVIRQAPGTLISADNARGSNTGDRYINSHWVLNGRVHVEHDNTVLDASSATVVFSNGLVQSIQVRGVPARFSHTGRIAGQVFKGTAGTITFDGVRRQARFDGTPWFSRPGIGEGSSGKPLVYDIGSRALRSDAGGPPDAPVRILFGDESRIEGRFDGNFRLGIDEDTVAGDKVTITQGEGTSITAENAQGSWSGSVANSRWLVSGKVHIEHDLAVMDAATATVVFADRLIQHIEVHGAPARFSHPGKVEGQPYTGSAETIAFDETKRQVLFEGHPSYSLGVAEGGTDQPVLYNLDSHEISSTDRDPNTRVRVTIRKDQMKKHMPAPRTPDRSTAQ